jgi:hypothetical protein
VLEICQEDNLTQRRKDAKKNQVFRTEDAKIFGFNCGFALAILTLLGNESALPISLTPADCRQIVPKPSILERSL